MALDTLNVIGLMSGTSHDGLDMAHCSFWQADGRWMFSINKAETKPYSLAWKQRLLALTQADTQAIARADLELGQYFGITAKAFIRKYDLNTDFIASHGHTIFHRPDQGLTLQIGEGKALAQASGLMVINDFRSSDVKLGGQGAPLVPVGDRLLFPQYDLCLNIGGIANISYEEGKERRAFDICPANMVFNHLASLRGRPYDDRGRMAASGKPIPGLLQQLESLPYYSLKGPRSLGREWVDANIFPLVNSYRRPHNIADIMATVAEHAAKRIGHTLGSAGKKVLITGGGAYNSHLLDRIGIYSKAEQIVPALQLVDFKEALIFAFLGVLRHKGLPNVLGSVTGSGTDHCAGTIH